MKLLAIETSTDACSVALQIDGEITFDHRLAAQQHGALVLPMIDALMHEAGITATQLHGVVYGRGPGSFTGVRIGVALTQGIALGADIGVIGVSTLQSVAQGCFRSYGDTHVAVSLDARMSEVYYNAYVCSDTNIMMPISNEQVCTQEHVKTLPNTQSAKTTMWRWAGSGAECYADVITSNYKIEPDLIRCGCWPQAMDLLSLALPRVTAGELKAPEYASPTYLRDKVAQTIAEREALK